MAGARSDGAAVSASATDSGPGQILTPARIRVVEKLTCAVLKRTRHSSELTVSKEAPDQPGEEKVLGHDSAYSDIVDA